ncbi:MAG: hypothetical protein AAFV88_23220 [Planctomycetota bacterium]
MAKCDLTIELDEPERIYRGGEKVSGRVYVSVDANVRCKALEVQSGWRTHGKGNVAKKTIETVTLFDGDWTAGDNLSYRFELTVSEWPPSYHGNFVNVDHYIDARVKIPWAFDPKAAKEFIVRPLELPDLAKTDEQKASEILTNSLGIIVGAFALVAVVLILGAFVANPIAGFFGLVVFSPVALFLGGKFLLPRWLLGNVETELLTHQLTPGESILARLSFEPRRRVTVNAITAKLSGSEVCVSGSGSNRTTHRNEFYDETRVLENATVLEAGVGKTFELEFPVPGDAPYSFDLPDNDLKWSIDLHVDIPRWPDWKRSLSFQVVPGQTSQSSGDPVSQSPSVEAESTSDMGLTFEEAAGHLSQSLEDDSQREVLVEAVVGITFEIEAVVERRLLYSGPDDPHVYEDGYAVWAHHTAPRLPLVLYIPHQLGDEFEQSGSSGRRFRGTVLGWDDQNDRLQIKVLVE